MSGVLSHNNYGKSNIRILKVRRNKPIHEVIEFSVNVQLEGDFETVHTKGDNSFVLPTDTMKNTVYALAKDNPVNSIEEFGLFLAKYFLENNTQVSNVEIEIEEKLWNRIMIEEKTSKTFKPHTHSFINSGNEKRTAKISMGRKENFVQSGIRDLLILKTTGSGFENYIKDRFTTLIATADRIFSTNVKAIWDYGDQNVNYISISNNVRQIILETFAEQYSLSVQQTLYDIGKKVIDTIKSISEISLSMPNKHYLLFNLKQFGMDNNNEIFIPTDEPFGLIEGTVKRV